MSAGWIETETAVDALLKEARSWGWSRSSEATIGLIHAAHLIRKLGADRVETAVYDEREVIENCTVEILRNSVTGEESVGWYRPKEGDNGHAED